MQSSNPYLSGKVWLLTFSSGGLGQSYFGKFSPSDVQSATSDSSTTTNDFTIDVDYADQVWNYPILQTTANKPIYDITSIKWTYIPYINSCTSSEANKRGLSNIIWIRKSSPGITCYALGYNSQNPVGNIQNPTLTSSYTITVATPSGSASNTINVNSGSTQGTIGNYAYASWLGNLGSGISHPSQSPYKTAYVNGNWRVISSSNYNNYISLVNQVPPSDEPGIEFLISQIKNAVNNAKVSQSFGTVNSATSLSNAVIKITTTNPVQFPITTLYIKASEIGIYTPTPDFRIQSTDSQCFKTGEQGTISVDIKNYGESGTGNVYAQCNSPFQVTQNVQLSLNKDESKTILLPLSASASQKTSGSCTVYVQSPGGTKSVSENTCVNPQITCNPNEIFCSTSGGQEVIKQCSSDGATSSIKEACSVGYTCEIKSGTPSCVLGGSSGGGFFSSIWSKIKGFFSGVFNFTGGVYSVLKNVVAIIVGIFSFLFGIDLFKNFRAIRKYRFLPWLLALIIAGLVVWLVYTAFFIGLVVFIIYIIFRLIIGGQLFALKRGVRALRG